jgi:putative radical SAM-modified peptide
MEIEEMEVLDEGSETKDVVSSCCTGGTGTART